MSTMDEEPRMEHPWIDEGHVVDRYLSRRLSADEEERFEEHLFACEVCLGEVEAGEELRRGLGAVAVEQAVQLSAQTGLMAWLRSRRPAQLAGLGALALAFVLLPALWLGLQPESGRQGASAFATPTGSVSTFSLGVVRDSAAPMAELRLDRDKTLLLFSLELPEVEHASYRVRLLRASGEVLWQDEGLEPSLYDSLFLALPAAFLDPGEYQIAIAGEGAGESSAEALLELRILPP